MGSQRCRKGVKSSLNECKLIDSYPQRILLIPLLGVRTNSIFLLMQE
jgi:hypothetical protein